MGIRNLLHSRRKVIRAEDAAKYGMVFIVDIKGNPVDPHRVFNRSGQLNPGFVPVKWTPPVLVIYTPEKAPVVFPAVLF